jgi:hypothetical protein
MHDCVQTGKFATRRKWCVCVCVCVCVCMCVCEEVKESFCDTAASTVSRNGNHLVMELLPI